ncbi:hypothetical protein [Nostoc sp. T09]|nr:hypothetical protein [Nostoc sp. T09]
MKYYGNSQSFRLPGHFYKSIPELLPGCNINYLSTDAIASVTD